MLAQRKAEVEYFIRTNYHPEITNISMSVDYQLPIGPDGCKFLVGHLNWPIESLNVNLYAIENEGMQAIILKGKQWPTLRELRVEKNDITGEGLAGISECGWKEISRVDFKKNKIKAKGFSELIKCDWKNLKHLELSHCEVGPGGTELLGRIDWPMLSSLNINYNFIGNEGVRELSKCSFAHLQNIDLSNNKLDGKAMFYISQMDLPRLESLNLNKNLIGRQNGVLSEMGCVYLSRSKLRNLTAFNVFGNDITLSGFREVMESGILQKNCFLEVIRNLFSFADIKPDLDKHTLFCNYFE